MSRTTKTNEKFVFAFGLDRHFGPFFQIWLAGTEEQEPLLDCDNTGIHSNPMQAEKMGRPLAKLLSETDERFMNAQARGIARPNLDAGTIDSFAKACGFEDIYRDIAGILDDPP